jgi:SAM-dependent methyltransferase
MNNIKLNIGCGTDYRPGFINLDASDELNKVDKLIDISVDSLADHFQENSVDLILANDIIEHHFHWEAARILGDFHRILKPGGECEIRVPDCEKIIRSWGLSIERKLTLLFGGQDLPQGIQPDMEASRKKYPQLFCHKYGWTRDRMERELSGIGFREIMFASSGTNFITRAKK